MHPRISSTLIISAALILTSGCATSGAKQRRSEPTDELRVTTKVVNEKKRPVAPPALQSPTYMEELFAFNGTPQPVTTPVQVMIIGDTGGPDPSNPNVFRKASEDLVVIEDWQWNEAAIRAGADIRLPSLQRNPAIEELKILAPDPTGVPISAADANTLGTQANGGLVAEKAAKEQPKIDTLELIQAAPPPKVFGLFLQAEGQKYPELRKKYRKLGISYRNQYDDAMRYKAANETIGFHPDHGWIAFQNKQWTDLSKLELTNWLENADYKKFAETRKTQMAQLVEENAIIEPKTKRRNIIDEPAIIEVAAPKAPAKVKTKDIVVDLEQ